MKKKFELEKHDNIKIRKISIIIPSYNYGSFLAESIESVLHQTILPDEIIIIDDGSTDNTKLIGKLYEKRYPNLIKFIRNKKNLGIVKTFNKAVDLTTGDYICFIGADNRIDSSYIEELSLALDKDKTVGIVYTDFALFGSRAKEEYLRFKEEYQGKIENKFYIINFPDFNIETKLILETENFIHGSSMYRKEAFDEINGYFDNEGKPEDHNLFLRMINNGWNAKRIAKPLLEYRQHSENQANIQVQMKEELKFFQKEFLPLLNKKEKEVTELNSIVHKIDNQVIELNTIVNQKDSQIIAVKKWSNKQKEDIETLTQDINTLQIVISDLTKKNQNLSIDNDTLLLASKSDIDISIVTYNSKKWMDSFFNSLTEQSYPLNKLHIYITDNSSTDDTYHYLKTLKEKYLVQFASFTLKQEKNLGFGYGHNNNFKQGKSKFVLVTNVDLEFEKDSIENIVKYALSDESTTASWEFRQKPYEHPKYYNPVTLETTWSSSACILFRKDAIDKISGYDDHIFMYGEDVELSYRLRDNGYTLKYYPKAVCWHYTYEVVNEIKELQYFGSTLAHLLIRMRYGTKVQLKEGLIAYKNLLNAQGLFINQRRKQLKYLLKLIIKAPFFLFNRKKNRNITYKFINWDYEFIRDGAFYNYTKDAISEEPLVSVIMRTCCERNGFLTEAIESIKNQTYSNIELIIVEDGTRSATNITENIKSDNITNVIYRPIEKAGRCHAGNEGLSAANGEYMVFLDDDDLFFADHIEVLVNAFVENPDVGACYASSFEVKTDIISKNPLKYEEKEFAIIHKEEFNRETMLHHNFIPIQSILFKRSLYEEYGGFDEALDNLEDWNLWTRYSYLNDFKFI
ncbi:MAG: glycosyltransferase, partial [Flavobacteriaceae bacterium]|nr:glycosyltransferase [Flavobacteriaceae bacterium]